MMKLPKFTYWLTSIGVMLLTFQEFPSFGQTMAPLPKIEQLKRTKEAEAKQYVAMTMRTEQGFFYQNGRFTTNRGEMGLGIKPETENYRYQIYVLQRPGRSKSESNQMAWVIATPKQASLRSYVGIVWPVNRPKASERLTATIRCESQQPNVQLKRPLALKQDNLEEVGCPPGFTPLQQ